MPRLVFRAMGCQVTAHIDGSAPGAAEALELAPRWFETWEQRLSRFRPDSELAQLNAQAGHPVRVSPVLWEVVRLALRVARLTAGRVTPALLAALERAGYDRSFDQLPSGGARLPGPPPVGEPPSEAAWRAIRCRPRDHTVQLPRGVRLDLGGVAKGWAAARAARALGAWGPALVEAGGDVAVSGPRAGGEAWPIGVADPGEPEGLLTTLRVRRGGVATSGRDFRRWQQGGVWRHHLLDARTGLPTQTDVVSATVLAPELWLAEMAAKVVFLLGSAAGLAWLEARPEMAGLIVVEDGPQSGMASRRLADYVWS